MEDQIINYINSNWIVGIISLASLGLSLFLFFSRESIKHEFNKVMKTIDSKQKEELEGFKNNLLQYNIKKEKELFAIERLWESVTENSKIASKIRFIENLNMENLSKKIKKSSTIEEEKIKIFLKTMTFDATDQNIIEQLKIESIEKYKIYIPIDIYQPYEIYKSIINCFILWVIFTQQNNNIKDASTFINFDELNNEIEKFTGKSLSNKYSSIRLLNDFEKEIFDQIQIYISHNYKLSKKDFSQNIT